jgi:hypothetical protein
MYFSINVKVSAFFAMVNFADAVKNWRGKIDMGYTVAIMYAVQVRLFISFTERNE